MGHLENRKLKNRNLIAVSIFFLVGILGLICTAIISATLRKHANLKNSDHFFVGVAGENFDVLCKTNLDMNFDESGNLIFLFETEDEIDGMVVWAFFYSAYPYFWESEGDVVSVVLSEDVQSNTGYRYSTAKKGDNVTGSIFRMNIDAMHSGRINVRLDPEHVIKKNRYFSSLQTPVVMAFQPALAGLEGNADIANHAMELLESVYQSQMSDIEQEEISRDIVRQVMSVGKIGDVDLSPAILNISAKFYYSDDFGFRNQHKWKVRPANYEEDTAGIKWKTVSNRFYASIESKNDETLEFAEKTINLFYGICSFLVSTSVIEIIELLRKTNGEQSMKSTIRRRNVL